MRVGATVLRESSESIRNLRFPNTESVIEAFGRLSEEEQRKLSKFTDEEQQFLIDRRPPLSGEVAFIGRDFYMPLQYGKPGSGWSWNFKDNITNLDPKDVLNWPWERVLGVLDHEAGHRRISRPHLVFSKEEWEQPGFPGVYNSVEDIRDNNFVNHAHPVSISRMHNLYADWGVRVPSGLWTIENQGIDFPSRLGTAGAETIRRWAVEQYARIEIPELPLLDEVRDIVGAIQEAAISYGLSFPSREEAEQSEDIILMYQIQAAEILRSAIWPVVQPLSKLDVQDQKLRLLFSKVVDSMPRKPSEEGEAAHLMRELTERARRIRIIFPGYENERQEPFHQVVFDLLPNALHQELNAHIEFSVQEEKNQREQERERQTARKRITPLRRFSSDLREELLDLLEKIPEEDRDRQSIKRSAGGKVTEQMKQEQGLPGAPIQLGERDWKDIAKKQEAPVTKESIVKALKSGEGIPGKPSGRSKNRGLVGRANKDPKLYTHTKLKHAGDITALENHLRQIFRQRRQSEWESGHRQGRRVNLKQLVREIGKKQHISRSEAWEKESQLLELDYESALLVDLSGSMQAGRRIHNAFGGAVIISEAFSRLNIPLSIYGFHSDLITFKSAKEEMSRDVQWRMVGMLDQVKTIEARHNCDGWAIREVTSELTKRPGKQRILAVLSDGHPAPTAEKSGRKFSLNQVIPEVMALSRFTLVGVGTGAGSRPVSKYYPLSMTDVESREIPTVLSTLFRSAIGGSESLKRTLRQQRARGRK